MGHSHELQFLASFECKEKSAIIMQKKAFLHLINGYGTFLNVIGIFLQ